MKEREPSTYEAYGRPQTPSFMFYLSLGFSIFPYVFRVSNLPRQATNLGEKVSLRTVSGCSHEEGVGVFGEFNPKYSAP